MLQSKIVVLIAVGLLVATSAEGSIPGVSGTLSKAMGRYRAEKERFEQLHRRHPVRAVGRTAWYLGKLGGALDAAHDMLRRMVLLSMAEGRQRARDGAPGPLANRRIVLDPGHGGADPGATGTLRQDGKVMLKLQEKDLTLDVSRRLAARLRAAGAEVFLTRSEDETLDLFGRGAVGRMLDPDLFMSVHFNYSVLSEPWRVGDRGIDGIDYTTVYVYAPSRKNLPMPGYAELLERRLTHRQPAASNRLASLLFGHLSALLDLDENPPQAVRKAMRAEEARRARLSRSRRTVVSWPDRPAVPSAGGETVSARALELYKQFQTRYPASAVPKGVRRSDFVVLREAAEKPAVLVETCFIGDRAELTKLRGTARRDSIALALYQGVCDYFKQ